LSFKSSIDSAAATLFSVQSTLSTLQNVMLSRGNCRCGMHEQELSMLRVMHCTRSNKHCRWGMRRQNTVSIATNNYQKKSTAAIAEHAMLHLSKWVGRLRQHRRVAVRKACSAISAVLGSHKKAKSWRLAAKKVIAVRASSVGRTIRHCRRAAEDRRRPAGR